MRLSKVHTVYVSHLTNSNISLSLPISLSLLLNRYSVDFELKKVVEESALDADKRIGVRKQIKSIFEEKYRSQTAKNEKKTAGAQYFFTKLRF